MSTWSCTAVAAAMACACASTWAQDAGSARRLQISPSLSIGQTVSDSFDDGAGDRGTEAITTVDAGLRVVSRSGRIRGSFDYGLSGSVHANGKSSNDVQNRLQANLTTDLVERHLAVDVQASISQQSISALGVQAADGSTRSANRAEVSATSVRPVLKGRLGGAVDAMASFALVSTDSGTAATSDSIGKTATVRFGAVPSGAQVGWGLDGSRQVVAYSEARGTQDDRVSLSLLWRPDPELQLKLRGGAESNNYTTADAKRYDNWGGGVEWTPSERTRIAFDADRRSFGNSHALSLQHRMRRSVWRYSDQQDVTSGSGETAGQSIAAYDLLFALFQSQEPDPVLREQLVNDVLRRNNLQPDTLLRTGFLTSAAALMRRQELMVALDGQRTSAVFTGYGTSSRRVDTLSTGNDSLVNGNRVRQQGVSLAVSHRLTPTGSLSLTAGAQRTAQDDGITTLRTALHTLAANWTDQLSRRTNMSLGVRHTEFYGDDAYTENAVTAIVRLQF
jgi:uncharacterized protein (PEP-CTERM system associated)